MTFSKHARILGSLFLAFSTFACSASDGEDGVPPSRELDSAETTKPVALTPEYVAEIRAKNAREMAASGLIYKLEVEFDHDVMFLAPASGGLNIVERIGPDAEGAVKEPALGLTPTQLFQHYKPGAEVPAVIAAATARLGAERVDAPAAVEVSVPEDGDQGLALLPGLAPQHTTSSGNHFQNDTHTFTGGATDTGCPTAGNQVLRLCWLNRTGGGFASQGAKNAVFHFGIYAGGSTLWGLVRNNVLQWEITVMQGEIWRSNPTSGSSVTWKNQWNGSGKSWHFGGTWYN